MILKKWVSVTPVEHHMNWQVEMVAVVTVEIAAIVVKITASTGCNSSKIKQNIT
jgi:hypothetical protein